MLKRSMGLLGWIILLGVGASFAQERNNPHRPKEVLVALKSGANINALTGRYGATLKNWLGQNVFLIATESAGSEQALATRLSQDRYVSFAEANYLLSVPEVAIKQRSAAFVDQRSAAFVDQRSAAFVDQRSAAFVDQRSAAFVDGDFPPELTGQPSMLQIRATEAHQFTLGQGVVVAIVDTGITAHPMFVNKTVSGYDFVNDDTDPSDLPGGPAYSHGAFVGSMVLLVAPRCRVMPLRAFSNNGVGAIAEIYQAMLFAVDNGARIINCSFGLDGVSAALDLAIDYARSRGVLVVGAAGNDSEPKLNYPSSDKEAIGVVGVDSGDIKATFSNWGQPADCSAPAVWLYGAYGDNQLAYWSGTSFSVPLVCGEAALTWSINQTATLGGAALMTLSSTDNIDALNPEYKKRIGTGRINCLKAVEAARR